jgi:hypothetical protein
MALLPAEEVRGDEAAAGRKPELDLWVEDEKEHVEVSSIRSFRSLAHNPGQERPP